MNERALTFGPANLVGVLTQPDPEVAKPSAPATIILNSGILHRAGASRISVRAARALAGAGLTSLRFDFSGIGDSEVRRDSIPIEERFVLETREAMDYLQETVGCDHFLVGGLCSGADGAFWAALQDERVVGVWQIDGFTYRTTGYYRRRLARKLARPQTWPRSVQARLPRRRLGEERDDEQFVRPEYRRVFPPKSEVETGLGRLLDRGVSLYFLFTGGLDYRYAQQHHEAFRSIDLGRRAQIRYLPECTHMITGLDHQEQFLEDLTQWATAVANGSDARLEAVGPS